MKFSCNNAKLNAKPDPIMVILSVMICYESLLRHPVSPVRKRPLRHLTFMSQSWIRERSLGYEAPW